LFSLFGKILKTKGAARPLPESNVASHC